LSNTREEISVSDNVSGDSAPEFTPAAPQVPAAPGAPTPPAGGAMVAAPAPQQYPVGQFAPTGPQLGKIRSTGLCILLCVVTFGIYSLVWYYQVHEEMKRHTGHGLGGGLALLLGFFVGIVMPFITASEVGALYTARGLRRPVSGATGLWSFPGAFIIVGPLVWFIKTNGALNSYWRSLGVS
jgi:hypothetical protein